MEMDRIAVKRELLKGLKGYANKGVAEGLKKEYCTCEEGGEGPEANTGPGSENMASLEGVSNDATPEMSEDELLLMLKGQV